MTRTERSERVCKRCGECGNVDHDAENGICLLCTDEIQAGGPESFDADFRERVLAGEFDS